MRHARPADVRRILHQRRQAGWLELARRYGRSFWLQGVLLTADPVATRALLVDRAHTQRRSRPHRLINRLTPGSDGVLFMDGAQWQQHARAVAPVFTRSHIESFGRFAAETIGAHGAAWAASPEGRDLSEAVTRLGADLVLAIGYGLDPVDPPACAYGRELVSYKQRTMDRDTRLRVDDLGIPLSRLADAPRALVQLLALGANVRRMRAMVAAIADRRLVCPAGRPNWIDGLVEAGVPFGEMVDGLNHMYGAYDASNFAITAGLYELSRHPAWRQRVRAEVDLVLGDRAFPTRADLTRLPDTIAFMRETLRRYPVAMAVFRETGAPLEVEGETIPAGTQVALLPYTLHHDPEHWAAPEQFDPSRWERGEPREPFAYIPFLEGPRKCLGQPLAEWLFVTVVGGLTRRFDIEVSAPDADLTPFLIPRFGVDLPFRVRSLG